MDETRRSSEDPELDRDLGRILRQAAHMRALSAVYHGVVHDLKGPLNALVVNLELLRSSISESPDVERQRRYARVLQEELGRLNEAIERLLPAAAPLADGGGPFELGELVDELTALVSTTARHQGVTLEVGDAGGNLRIAGHRDRIKQAVLCLILNALEAMPDGGVLGLELERRDGRAAVSVTDTGPGVPRDARDRMFDLYFSTKERHDGIGLFVARSMVESTNGAIEHTPGPDGGSRFTLTLPLAA